MSETELLLTFSIFPLSPPYYTSPPRQVIKLDLELGFRGAAAVQRAQLNELCVTLF